MKNLNALRALALLVTFISGAFAHSFYFKATTVNLVKLEVTKSGQFVIKEGHIYALEELEAATIQTPAYSTGASQEYHLPTGRK
jgi:hypothetical protein